MTILQLHIIGTDMLGDTARLTGNHVGVADVVEQGGLTVVHVTHHGNDGRTRQQVFRLVGLFEGGGYSAKGVWRPYYECRMKNNTAPGFCPVCERAINKMIDYYVK